MDPSKEESASEKERKPAGEESEEPSSKLLMTSTRMWTRSREKCCDLEAEISRMKVKLEVLKRMLAVPVLLLTTLEEMNPHELKTFQCSLTSGLLPDCPPIPESQLENADRQDTVDQMVKTYGPERAVEITLRILRGMKRVDLAEKLETDHRGVSPSFSGTASTSHLSLFPPRPRSVLSPVGFLPLSCLLSSSSSSFGSSMNSLLLTSPGSSGQLRSQEEAASEMERKPAGEESGELPSTSSGILTRSEEECRRLETEISRLEDYLRFMKRPSMLDVPALLLTTLEELTGEQLKTFQSKLTSGWMLGFPLHPRVSAGER
ncbi:pyrin-like [Coregonus clupeaformis]|uniref:pyrin-like n=1 Tax=Coregonus clupeaformis TaxID=59861 RepID=UPI001E1C62E7|nr:pyrin-like [Coregonus clupeaformis]